MFLFPEPQPKKIHHLHPFSVWHLHTQNNHTYTPYDTRDCPSCRPVQITANETHILLHCPHFSPLAQQAIQSLFLNLNLRRFDLWAWATYIDTQKVTSCSVLPHPNSPPPTGTPFSFPPRKYPANPSPVRCSLPSIAEPVWRTWNAPLWHM